MNRASRVPRRAEAGFTLIEALVAMMVLSFGLIAVTNLLVVAASSNAVANQGTAAAAVASEQMENLKALGFTDPRLASGGSLTDDTPSGCADPNDVVYCGDTNLPGVGRIHTRWQIQDVVGSRGSDLSQPAGLKFITVRSEGVGALTAARSRAEFSTFRTENPDPSVTPTPTPTPTAAP